MVFLLPNARRSSGQGFADSSICLDRIALPLRQCILGVDDCLHLFQAWDRDSTSAGLIPFLEANFEQFTRGNIAAKQVRKASGRLFAGDELTPFLLYSFFAGWNEAKGITPDK